MLLRQLACVLGLVLWTTALFAQSTKVHNPNVVVPVSLTLTRYGFERKMLSLPPGWYSFTVFNRSPISTASLTIDRMPGKSITGVELSKEVEVKRQEKKRFTGTVQLTPGTYRVRIVEVPGWAVEVDVKQEQR